jgi:predicted RNase H-like nuclease (RuvC/YqgF family)
VFDNLKDEIAALVTCFTEKLLKAAEKHNAKNKDKLAEMEKEISELKAELRELKNIRESVERYQSRYVKR